MKSDVIRIIPLCLALVLASCKTAEITKGEKKIAQKSLLSAPSVTNVTGKIAVTVGSIGPLTVNAGMSWDKCINLSYNLLGLMELANVTLTPDDVTIINRVNGVYCREPYSALPYVGILKLDFKTVQGILWGRAISNGKCETDAEGNVSGLALSSVAYKASAAYSGRVMLSQDCSLPSVSSIQVNSGNRSLSVRLRYSGFARSASEIGSSASFSGLRKVTSSEMIDILKKYL